MTNYGTNIFLIDGDGIFDLNVDLSVIPIEALKDRFLTLGHIASRDEAEDLICITEDKQHKVPVGFAQNIKQLESTSPEKYPRQVTLRIRSNLPKRPWTRTTIHTNYCVIV
uniref:Uncharacterized protein n=1 Tax=Rhizophagus irregularis (strain DAOM 181602 / DAOM 197198 / MUCL 43194) TaxID=747089 RepID=U9SU63_RHIID